MKKYYSAENNMVNSAEILKILIESKNINYSQLAKSLKILPQNLYDIKSGKAKLSRRLADLIVTVYPDISRSWLLTGEGNMLNEEMQDPKPEYTKTPTNKDLQENIDKLSEKVDKMMDIMMERFNQMEDLNKK